MPGCGVWPFSGRQQRNQGRFPAGKHTARAVSGRSSLKGRQAWTDGVDRGASGMLSGHRSRGLGPPLPQLGHPEPRQPWSPGAEYRPRYFQNRP